VASNATLQMAHFDRGREPVLMGIRSVLDLEDVARGKMWALAVRVGFHHGSRTSGAIAYAARREHGADGWFAR
jgi:hypothetical protein